MTWKRCEWLKSAAPERSHNLCYIRSDTGTESDERLLWRADAAAIQATQSTITNAPSQEREPVGPAAPAGCDTLERLVELRLLHQTQRAANSVRSRGEPKTQKSQDGQPMETSAAAKRQKLCLQMADVIRRSGTGLERCARWRSAPGTMDPSETSELNRNSANAEAVAKDRVKAVSSSTPHYRCTTNPIHDAPFVQALGLRRKFFTSRINYARHLADGLVGSGVDRSPLRSGSWAFTFSEQIVYVGEGTWIALVFCPPIADALTTVLALYSKEAGAGSRHAWQSSTNSIGAISYLVVRVYEAPTSGRTNQFRSLLNSQTITRADRAFLHIPATQFLCRLQDPPAFTTPGKLVLSEKDWLVFQKVAGSLPLREKLAQAIKELNASARGKK